MIPQMPQTPQTPINPTHCWACRRDIGAGDPYCRWCGKRQTRGEQWYFKPFWILVLGLVALGPFVLPLVWRSPYIGRTNKWILSVALVAYTLATLAVGWVLVEQILHSIQQIADTQALM